MQLDGMCIYGEFDRWICIIGEGFRQSMEDLVVMIPNIYHKCIRAIRIDKGKLNEPLGSLSWANHRELVENSLELECDWVVVMSQVISSGIVHEYPPNVMPIMEERLDL